MDVGTNVASRRMAKEVMVVVICMKAQAFGGGHHQTSHDGGCVDLQAMRTEAAQALVKTATELCLISKQDVLLTEAMYENAGLLLELSKLVDSNHIRIATTSWVLDSTTLQNKHDALMYMLLLFAAGDGCVEHVQSASKEGATINYQSMAKCWSTMDFAVHDGGYGRLVEMTA